MTAYVRSASLGNYAEVARRVGLDPDEMIASAGLNPAFLSNPDLRIPTRAVVALLEESARRSACATFGLQMAESWRMSDFGVISLLLTHQPTLRDALAATIRHRHLLNDSLSLWIEEAGELVIVREELVGEGAARSRQAIELAIGVIFRMFRALLGAHWRPREVRFTHPAPPQLGVHRRIFGTHVAFDQEFNGIVCAAADIDRPNPGADPGMAGHAQKLIDAIPGHGAADSGAAQEVRRAIRILLPLGQASIGRIAQAMGMTARTLQRQLDGSGETYGSLLNEARLEMVPRYLGNPAYSLVQVGELLGYEFPSSFTRWFRKQFGKSPARWRRERARKRAKPVRGAN
jgi:AraC-like DNA-binding protein